MTLPKRQLGRTDMETTTLGLGAWAMGGGGWAFAWGPQDDDDSIRTIQHAVAQGINWVDTAAVYGYGHSEEVVGRAIRQISPADRPLVFTKGGLRWGSDPNQTPARDLSPKNIRREAEDSLRRLGVERIDLYQFHWPDELGVPVDESWGEMVRLIDEGKVRAGGVSNFDVGLLEGIEPLRHVDSLQPPFSMIHRSTAETLLPWCVEQQTGVIVYSPMRSGLLTGRWSAARVASLPEDDFRKRNPDFQEPTLSRSLALVEKIQPIADRLGTNLPSLAVAWTLVWPGITGAIVGARTPEQVDSWIGAAHLELGPGDLAEIAGAIELTEAGEGPLQPHTAARQEISN